MGGGKELCQVCKIPSKLKCTKCNVAVYCSRDHQKQDWKAHKKECWPLAEAFQDTYGKYWVASRDIPEGSIILKECPAISGPHIPSHIKTPKRKQLDLYTEEQQSEGELDHACLGCNKLLNEETKKLCSKCGWPVCGPECEEMPIHSQNECPFFMEQKIKYPIQELTNHMASFGICLLRGMFLHRNDPVLCNKLINNLEDLDPLSRLDHYGEDKMNQYLQLRTVFKAHKFRNDEIWSAIFGILPSNCISYICKVDGKESQEMSVFPSVANLFIRECVPNADQTTRRLSTAANLTGSNLQIQIRALRPISKGDTIIISFGHSALDHGTEERIDYRLKMCKSICACRRCVDPTELGTYSSAIKCKSCSTGFMLPGNFLILDSPFICSNCPGKPMIRRKVKKFIFPIFQDFLATEKLVGVAREGEDGMKKLEIFIGKHSGNKLHPNHWILQRAMARFCFALAPSFAQNPANIERALIYGRKLISLADLFTPGLVLIKIGLMLRTAKYGCLDLKNKISSLSEEDVEKRRAEIHEWASTVLKYWEQEMAEEPSAIIIEKKSVEVITKDMTLARSLIQEAEEMVLNNGSSVDGGKLQQMSISGDFEGLQ